MRCSSKLSIASTSSGINEASRSHWTVWSLVPPTDGETKPPRPANCSAATQASQTRSSGLQRMRLWAWALRGHWALLGPKRLTTPLLLAAPQFQRFLTASGRVWQPTSASRSAWSRSVARALNAPGRDTIRKSARASRLPLPTRQPYGRRSRCVGAGELLEPNIWSTQRGRRRAQHLTGAAKVGQFQMPDELSKRFSTFKSRCTTPFWCMWAKPLKRSASWFLRGLSRAFHWVEQFQCQGARNLMQQFNYELALAQSQWGMP